MFKVKVTFVSGQVLNLISPLKPVISDDSRIMFVKRSNNDYDSGTFIPISQIRYVDVDQQQPKDEK